MPGKGVRSAQGSVRVTLKSKDVSGQLPANVQVNSNQILKLEVTNLIGGTQALVTVDHGRYEITNYREAVPTHQVGYDYWGGIPLKWATPLFLGQIPCPAHETGIEPQLELLEDGGLKVTLPQRQDAEKQVWIYQFKEWEAHPWPVSLAWAETGRRGGTGSEILIQFESPEKGTGSPEHWEAKSNYGQVKVKWRSREIDTGPIIR